MRRSEVASSFLEFMRRARASASAGSGAAGAGAGEAEAFESTDDEEYALSRGRRGRADEEDDDDSDDDEDEDDEDDEDDDSDDEDDEDDRDDDDDEEDEDDEEDSDGGRGGGGGSGAGASSSAGAGAGGEDQPITIGYLDNPRGSLETRVPPRKINIAIGGTGSGKSVMMLNLLLHHRRYYTFGLAVCPTTEGQEQLSRIMPSSLIVPELTIPLLKMFLDFGHYMSTIYDENKMPMSFLYLDDMAYDTAFFKTREFKRLINNGRHMGIGLYMTVQYEFMIPPAVRMQAHHVFVFKTTREDSIANYQTEFFSIIPKRDFFSDSKSKRKGVFERATGNRRALVRIKDDEANSVTSQIYVHYVTDLSYVDGRHKMCWSFLWWLHDVYFFDRTEERARVTKNQMRARRQAALRGQSADGGAFMLPPLPAAPSGGRPPPWMARGAGAKRTGGGRGRWGAR